MPRKKKTRKKKQVAKAPTLASKMAAAFEKILDKQLLDAERKRFFVAFMLAAPILEPYDMNAMEGVLERKVGREKIFQTAS